MSYDITIVDPATGNELKTKQPHHLRGGIYVDGGTDHAWLNITYNYEPHLREIWKTGLKELDGLTGEEALPKLRDAVRHLGTDRDADYWACTKGNAGHALADLMIIVAELPQGKLRVNG